MQATFMRLLKAALFNPASQIEFIVSAVLALMVFILVLNKVGTAFDLTLAQTGRSLTVLAVLVVVPVLVIGLLDQRVPLAGWMQGAIAAALLLAVVTPVACFLLKGRYFSALFSLVISLVAMVVIVLLSHTAFRAISGGGKSVGRGIDHNREVEQLFNE